jgi:hypothetical protein
VALTEADINGMVGEILAGTGLTDDALGMLASQLVWRMGRLDAGSPVTVRVGLTNSARLFAELPRLHNVTDGEVEAALHDGTLHVEWIGPRP